MVAESRFEKKQNSVVEKSILPLFEFILIVIIFYVHYLHPVFYVKLITEDYWGEWITFSGFLFGFLFFFWLFWASKIKIQKLWFLIIALGCFFIAMEEISWGQRLFVFATPEFMANKNFQGEITLHNIEGFWSNQWTNMRIMGIIFLIYGFIVPLFTLLSKKTKGFFKQIYAPIPSLSISLFFIAVFVFFIFYPTVKSDEIGEMFMGFAIGSFGFEYWLNYYTDRGMKFLKKFVNKKWMAFLFIAGFAAIVGAAIFTPAFIASKFSPDGTLHDYTIGLIQGYREILVFIGIVFIILSFLIFYKVRKSDTGMVKSSQNKMIHKNYLLSIFCVIIILLSYKLMQNYGSKVQFKNRLNDIAAQDYYQKRLYTQAEKIFSYIEEHPKFSTEATNFHRARNLKAMKQDEQALTILKGVLQQKQEKQKLHPDDHAIVVDMAIIYRLMDKNEMADSLFQQALQIEYSELDNNEDAKIQRDIRMSIGSTYFKMGNYNKAISEYKIAQKLSQTELDIREADLQILYCQNAMNSIK